MIVCPRDRNVYATDSIGERVIMVPGFVGNREIVGIYRGNRMSTVKRAGRHNAGYNDLIADD